MCPGAGNRFPFFRRPCSRAYGRRVPAPIAFVRLTAVPLRAVVELLNEPRLTRHLPLAGQFSDQAAAEWVAAKDG